MLDRAKLVNIVVFMERAPMTGKEALGWQETYQAVMADIQALDTPPSPRVPATPKFPEKGDYR